MSWFTSLLGGFASGMGYGSLGSKLMGTSGATSGWAKTGQVIGTLVSASRGGQPQPQPQSDETHLPEYGSQPPQPQRRQQRRTVFNIQSYLRR